MVNPSGAAEVDERGSRYHLGGASSTYTAASVTNTLFESLWWLPASRWGVVAPEQRRKPQELRVDLFRPRHVFVRDGSGGEDAEELGRELDGKRKLPRRDPNLRVGELARERTREDLVLVLRRRQHHVRDVPADRLDRLDALSRRRDRIVYPEPPVPHLDDRASDVRGDAEVEPYALLLLQRPHLALDDLHVHDGATGEERDEGEQEAGEVDVPPLRLDVPVTRRLGTRGDDDVSTRRRRDRARPETERIGRPRRADDGEGGAGRRGERARGARAPDTAYPPSRRASLWINETSRSSRLLSAKSFDRRLTRTRSRTPPIRTRLRHHPGPLPSLARASFRPRSGLAPSSFPSYASSESRLPTSTSRRASHHSSRAARAPSPASRRSTRVERRRVPPKLTFQRLVPPAARHGRGWTQLRVAPARVAKGAKERAPGIALFPPHVHRPPYSRGMSLGSMSSSRTLRASSVVLHTFTLASVDGDANGENTDQSTPNPLGGLTMTTRMDALRERDRNAPTPSS